MGNFYIRIQAEESLEPMSGKTIVLSQDEASTGIAEAVVKASQDTYAIEHAKQPKTGRSEGKSGKGNKEVKKQNNETDKLGKKTGQDPKSGKGGKKKRGKNTNPKKDNNALENNDDK
jgi:hypothetical protein